MVKKLLFLTGTRADFGKLKSLIQITTNDPLYDVTIFATGMHMQNKYGYTVKEIEKSGFKKIYKFINHTSESTMDLTLAKTIDGLSSFIKEDKPDLIIVHGDRVEALAGAITGALNNILVAHIEGGEVSGTIDELIRHAVSKMSHAHFVANEVAKKRLIQMGEDPENVFIIGSPDIDIMFSKNLPALETVKQYYQIPYDTYAIVMFHPVTTEYSIMKNAVKELVDSLLQKKQLNFVVIYPNNDLGSQYILDEYERLGNLKNFRIFRSIRFEYFLVLLKNAQMIIGNSSAGIREAPYYKVPVINVGPRQTNRTFNKDIINVKYDKNEIIYAIDNALGYKCQSEFQFGDGGSNERFLDIIKSESFWRIPTQKYFIDKLY